MSGTEKALGLLKNLPRVDIQVLKPFPGLMKKKPKSRRGKHGGRTCGRGDGGQGKRSKLPYIGFEGNNTPFYLRIPKEPYYAGHHLRRQYPPVSLLQLQRMVDLGRVDPQEPIDLTTICNTQIIKVDTVKGHYGINLTDEGADNFDAKVNIEVQWASELTIAAIEKNGGTIITRYYNLPAVKAMSNPAQFFNIGNAIPKCKPPPKDALEYYIEAKNRGYLADEDKIAEARFELAQKYGYLLPDITKDPLFAMLSMRKRADQMWYGLDAGWVVNLKDKTILKPTDPVLKQYYSSS